MPPGRERGPRPAEEVAFFSRMYGREEASDPPRDAEMEAIRDRWVELDLNHRLAVLMSKEPGSCPCGNGALPGHGYYWCCPPGSWLTGVRGSPPAPRGIP